jgi:hypothetical protein
MQRSPVDCGLADLITRAQGSGTEAAEAAMSLLEAFIDGDRSPPIADYIARCLRAYLRGGTPIELALHLSSALPPTVLGAAGEGDRRRAQRGPSRAPEDRSGKTEAADNQTERRQAARETQAGRSRNRRQGAWDKAAPEKRARPRTGRRTKPATRAPGTE